MSWGDAELAGALVGAALAERELLDLPEDGAGPSILDRVVASLGDLADPSLQRGRELGLDGVVGELLEAVDSTTLSI